jgi:glycosyltransferase involved in cell wall biosynthesis
MNVVGETESLGAFLQSYRPDLVHVANPAHIGIGIIREARSLGIPVVVTAMDFWWVCPKATLLRGEGGICDGTPPWHECLRCIAADHPRPGVRWLAHFPSSMSLLSLVLFAARSLRRGLTVPDAKLWMRRREELAAALKSVQGIVFPSGATRAVIEPMLSGVHCELIPYGLSPEWFASPRVRPERPIPPEQMVIGFAGALLPHKAPHLLLEAVRRLGWTTTRVRLAGPVPDAGYARQLRVAAAGLNVEFTGALETAKMPEFLRSLDVLAMTSTWPENLPFIVLEAQAAGVPVVGSRLPGIAEQIADEQLRFTPGSAEGLSEAIDWVRRHPQQLSTPSVHGIEEMTDRTQEIYLEALAGRRLGRQGGGNE